MHKVILILILFSVLLPSVNALQDADIFIEHLYETSDPSTEIDVTNKTDPYTPLYWEASARNKPCLCYEGGAVPTACLGDDGIRDSQPPYEFCSAGGAAISPARVYVWFKLYGYFPLTDGSYTTTVYPWVMNKTNEVFLLGDTSLHFYDDTFPNTKEITSLADLVDTYWRDIESSHLGNLQPGVNHRMAFYFYDNSGFRLHSAIREFQVDNPGYDPEPAGPGGPTFESSDISIPMTLETNANSIRLQGEVINNDDSTDAELSSLAVYCNITDDTTGNVRINKNSLDVSVNESGNESHALVSCTSQSSCSFDSANNLAYYKLVPTAPNPFLAIIPFDDGVSDNTYDFDITATFNDNGGTYRCKIRAFINNLSDRTYKDTSTLTTLSSGAVEGTDAYVDTINTLQYYVLPSGTYSIQLEIANSGTEPFTTENVYLDAALLPPEGEFTTQQVNLDIAPGTSDFIVVTFDLSGLSFGDFLGVENFEFEIKRSSDDYTYYSNSANLLISRLIKIFNPEIECIAARPENDPPNCTGFCNECICNACFEEDTVNLTVPMGQNLSYDLRLQNPLQSIEDYSLDYNQNIFGVPGLGYSPSVIVTIDAADPSSSPPFGVNDDVDIAFQIPAITDEPEFDVNLISISVSDSENIYDQLNLLLEVEAPNLTITDFKLIPDREVFKLTDPQIKAEITIKNTGIEDSAPVNLVIDATSLPPGTGYYTDSAVLDVDQTYTGTTFDFPPFTNIGTYEIIATVESLPGELQLSDNQQSIYITVVEQGTVTISELSLLNILLIIFIVMYLVIRK